VVVVEIYCIMLELLWSIADDVNGNRMMSFVVVLCVVHKEE